MNNINRLSFLPIYSYNRDVRDFPRRTFDKFVFTLDADCSGLGNQMYKIASVYGIGLYPNVNRTPGLNLHKSCLKKYIEEFSETFPNVTKLVKFDVSSLLYFMA